MPSFPVDVCHFQQSDIIFKADSIELIEKEVIFIHDLSQFTGSPIKLF